MPSMHACVHLLHFYINFYISFMIVYGCENMSLKNCTHLKKNNMAAIADDLKIIDMF